MMAQESKRCSKSKRRRNAEGAAKLPEAGGKQKEEKPEDGEENGDVVRTGKTSFGSGETDDLR